MEKEKTIYLIDGTAYIYRAYHAIRGLSNSRGLPTNAIFGFTRMLMKLMEDRSPQYVAMFFDAKGPTFRHEMYKDYKANRPPMPEDMVVQLPYIKKITAAFNLPRVFDCYRHRGQGIYAAGHRQNRYLGPHEGYHHWPSIH
jgi:DNA polymerase-1